MQLDDFKKALVKEIDITKDIMLQLLQQFRFLTHIPSELSASITPSDFFNDALDISKGW